jgi:hypothetical protein
LEFVLVASQFPAACSSFFQVARIASDNFGSIWTWGGASPSWNVVLPGSAVAAIGTMERPSMTPLIVVPSLDISALRMPLNALP